MFATRLILPGLLFATWAEATPVSPSGVLAVASRLLDEAEVSYVYGGYQVGDSDSCKQCSACLAEAKPKPFARLKACAVCASCSLDCSHFTELVFREAGLPYPYLDTSLMLSLRADQLLDRYKLVDLDLDLGRSAPGDLLVYDGHVVLLEKRHAPIKGHVPFRGDIVHATGGQAIKTPGEGIQRERFIDLAAFRGPLRRILRHAQLGAPAPLLPKMEAARAPAKTQAPAPKRRLRPVAKRQQDE